MTTSGAGSLAAAEVYFAENSIGRQTCRRIDELLATIGSTIIRVAATHVAWAPADGGRDFAFLWSPHRSDEAADELVVLTIDLERPDRSRRWQQSIEVRTGLWSHHLEVTNLEQLDDQVVSWLAEAFTKARQALDPKPA